MAASEKGSCVQLQSCYELLCVERLFVNLITILDKHLWNNIHTGSVGISYRWHNLEEFDATVSKGSAYILLGIGYVQTKVSR